MDEGIMQDHQPADEPPTPINSDKPKNGLPQSIVKTAQKKKKMR
jgi:hypothetical protein